MQIDIHTPPAELARLFIGVTRQELLKNTPLNFRLFIRYALLFIMFPGMVAGFWVGLGISLVFFIILLALLFTGGHDVVMPAVWVWLLCGVCVFAYICWSTLRAALKVYRARNTARPADAPLGEATPPGSVKLRWHKSDSGEEWVAEWALQAAHPGIYAVMLAVQNMDKRRLFTVGRTGVCTVQASGDRGEFHSLLLYKLEPGEHRLRWILTPRKGTPPAATLTLLHLPHE